MNFSKNNLKQILLVNGKWAVLGKIVSITSGLFINVLLARLLPPDELGLYFLLLSLVAFTNAIGTMGLLQINIKEISRFYIKSEVKSINEYIRLSNTVVFFNAFVISMIIYTIIKFFFESTYSLAVFTSLFAFFSIIQKNLGEIIRGFNHIKLFSLFSGPALIPFEGILPRFFLISFIIFFSKGINSRINIELIIFFLLISILISIIIISVSFYKKYTINILQFNFKLNKYVLLRIIELLNESWPLLINNVMRFILTQSDIWLIGIITDKTNVAMYGNAKRIVNLLLFPSIIIRTIGMPLIGQWFAASQKNRIETFMRFVSTFLTATSFFAFFFLILGGQIILNVLYGSFYIQAYPILSILSLNVIVISFSGLSEDLLYMSGNQKISMKVFLFSSIVILILGSVLTNIWAAKGMAIAIVIGFIVQNFLFILIILKKLDINPLMKLNLIEIWRQGSNLIKNN